MREYKLTIKTGDMISVGRFRYVQTEIKSISIDEHGQPRTSTVIIDERQQLEALMSSPDGIMMSFTVIFTKTIIGEAEESKNGESQMLREFLFAGLHDPEHGAYMSS